MKIESKNDIKKWFLLFICPMIVLAFVTGLIIGIQTQKERSIPKSVKNKVLIDNVLPKTNTNINILTSLSWNQKI